MTPPSVASRAILECEGRVLCLLMVLVGVLDVQ